MPTIQQIEQAMIAADRAGDTAAAQILAEEIRRLMEEAQPRKRGVGAAFQRGLESQLSAGRTGAGVYTGSPEEAAEAARAGLARQEDIGRRYEDQIGLDRLKKVYEEKGLLAAGKEVGRQIPLALAEQAPQIAATLGSARLGSMAFAPFGPAGVIGGGLLGATAPSFLMASGAQAERRAQEQVARGEPVSIDRGSLTATAAPSAALDVAATLIPLGKTAVSKVTGIPLQAFSGRTAAQAEKLANEKLLATLTKGTATGVAVEVPTEILQQMLERAQAGLPLASPDAYAEYGDTAYRVSLLGPLGAAGRLSEKGAARDELAAQQAAPTAATTTTTAAPVTATPTEAPQLAAEIPIEERRFTDITPVPGAPTPAAERRFTDITPVPAAPALFAAPEKVDIFKMMDSYDTLKSSLDPLADQIYKARQEGDNETARALMQEYRDNEAAMNALATQITEAGGVLESSEEAEAAYNKQLKTLDSKIAKEQNIITEMSRADVRDYDAVDKAEKRLAKLQAERDAAEEEFQRKRGVFRVKETPPGQQISLFDTEEQKPKAEEVLKFKTESGQELTGPELERMSQGPMRPDQDYLSQQAVVAAQQRGKVLEKYQEELAELAKKDTRQMAPDVRNNHDEQMHQALMKVRQLENEVTALKQGQSPAALKAAKNEAFGADSLFGNFNILNTAIQNQDQRTIDRIAELRRKADLAAFGHQHYKISPREEVYQMLKDRIGGILRRERNYDSYEATVNDQRVEIYVSDAIAKEITDLRRKVEAPRTRTVNGKKVPVRSMLQMLYDYYDDYNGRVAKLEKAKADKADKKTIAAKKAAVERAKEKYQKQFDAVMVERNKLDALLRGLYKTTGEFAPAPGTKGEPTIKTPRQKQEELEKLGTSRRETSREVKTAANVRAGKVKISEAKVAQELGETMDEYQSFAAPYQKRLQTKADQHNKFIAGANERLAKLKEKYGDTSEKYKTAEASLVKVSKERLAELNKLKDELTKLVGAKAVELGKQHPDFEKKLAEAKEKYQEALQDSVQEVKNLRTPQVTRKLPKLKETRTASEESKAETQRRQEAFESELSEEKGARYEYQQREEARERTLRSRQAKAGKGTAMQAAMTKAAKDKAEALAKEGKQSDIQALAAFDTAAALKQLKEEGKFARGVEVESPDLTAAQIKMLEDNNLTGVLRGIADDKNASDLNRVIAARLAAMLDETNVELADTLYDSEGKEVLGEAISTNIKLSRAGGLSQEVLLHEATHAAVERVIQMPDSMLTKEQVIAKRELLAMYNSIKNDPSITSSNAKSSLSEFAAEVFSNRNLQEQLRKKKWRGSDMWEGLKSVILRMLGIKVPDTMLGAALKSVDLLMIPSSVKIGRAEKPVSRQYSAKDIAALDTGSNSMRVFAEQFGPEIKQKDRTPQDVDRLAAGYLTMMSVSPEDYIAQVDGDKLDYKSALTMPDGKVYDEENPLHFVEANIETVNAAEAINSPQMQDAEARAINKQRKKSLTSLVDYLALNQDYTLAEQALVAKAASKYGVIAGKDGRLKLVNISDNNRHPIAVVGHESANAVVEELRKGKSLKDAFIDGLQAIADRNAKENLGKNGWQKFAQSSEYDAAVALNAGAAGTPWCTGSSLSHAESHIKGGDFYIYYEKGKPQVAVRMEGTDKIREIRGNSPGQALNKEQQEIAKRFLQDKKFKSGDDFIEAAETKEALADVLAGRRDFTAAELVRTKFRIEEGGIDERALDRLLHFRPIFGYLSRDVPSGVLQKVADTYKQQIIKKYEDGYFLYASARNKEAKIEAELFGKTYTSTINKVKALQRLQVSSTKEPVNFANLEYVGDVASFTGGDLNLPKLKHIQQITVFGGDSRSDLLLASTFKVADGAVIDRIRPGGDEFCPLDVEGAVKINEAVLLQNNAKLYLSAPEAEYVVVDTFDMDTLSADVQSTYQTLLRRRLREEKLDTMFLYEPAEDIGQAFGVAKSTLSEYSEEETAKATAAFKDLYDVLGKVFGRYALGTAYSEVKQNNKDALANVGGDAVGADVMLSQVVDNLVKQQKTPTEVFSLAEKQYDAIKGYLKEAPYRNPFPNGIGSVDAANIVRPGDEAFTHTQERPRYAPKDIGVQEEKPGVFSFKSYVQPGATPSSIVADEPRTVDTLKANFLGIAGRVQFVDKFAAISEAFKKGMDAKKISQLEASNGEYYLRFGENRSQYAQQALTNGPLSRVVSRETPEGKEYIYRSEAGANLMRVFELLEKSGIKNSTELDRMFTVYQAGKRAKQVGWEKLWVGNPAKAKAEYDAVMAQLNSNPQMRDAFEAASKEYKKFNDGLIDFVVQTGAMTKDQADKLKSIDYVPYYRVNKGSGDVELFTDKEVPIRIGNIKDEPQLQQLVGDNTQILPLSVSSVQNAFMLVDMGLRNQRVKDTSFLLHKIGFAKTLAKGEGPANRDTVRFKVKGESYYAIIDTDLYGIPADLIVKGMEGIKTSLPMAVKMMGVPADILRKFVTRNPAYAIRQAIRDPLTAWMTTGTDGVPIFNSFKQLSSMVAGRSETERKLMETGAISSNVFTGGPEDFKRFLRDISAGKSGWEKLMAKADAFAMQGDAATRAVVYEDSIAKGLSEQQALLRTLESMNFGRRGLSPTMYYLNTLIPFFNAQVQGLDVLYRAFTNKMPYSEQLKIREKLIARGLLMGAATLAYAAMMQDDEAYKRAKPEERLANWFVYIPGMDQPLKVPIPFELGYLFKSLPEAVFNMGAADEKSQDITKGMGKLVMLSNPFALPQAVKPVTELYLGKSFFGGDIESQREITNMLPTERFRSTTTELSKVLGGATGDAGITPIGWDHLFRGYTGGLGIALISLANPILNTEASAVEQPSKKLHQQPFIGGLFQPVEGRGTLDAAYERMLEIQQAKGTFNRLVEEGRKKEALEFLDTYRSKLIASSLSGAVQQKLGELATVRRRVIGLPNLSQEQKDKILERIDDQQVLIAQKFLSITGETKPQADRP